MSILKERLKSLKRQPLYQTAIDGFLVKDYQNIEEIKFFISNEINLILKQVYEPLGMWKQNPSTTHKKDLGVIINGEWSSLNQANTNYSCHTYLFNKCNQYLVDMYQINGFERFFIDGTEYSVRNLFYFDSGMTNYEIKEMLSKIFKLISNQKNNFFGVGSEMYSELIKICNNTMDWGNKTQKYYEDNINFFFDDIVSIKSSKGKGDYYDRTEGIDIWKTHKDGKITKDQVKLIKLIELINDCYVASVVISYNSVCDYYVLVEDMKNIYLFRNDNSKIKVEGKMVFFNKSLLVKMKEYVRKVS